MKVPLAYADQFYVLRDHIRFVRNRFMETLGATFTKPAKRPGRNISGSFF